jgi:hypothetical protein
LPVLFLNSNTGGFHAYITYSLNSLLRQFFVLKFDFVCVISGVFQMPKKNLATTAVIASFALAAPSGASPPAQASNF